MRYHIDKHPFLYIVIKIQSQLMFLVILMDIKLKQLLKSSHNVYLRQHFKCYPLSQANPLGNKVILFTKFH